MLIPEIAERYGIDAVYANRSYSPLGKLRDQKTIANLGDTPFYLVKDFLLVEPWEVEQRKVFTPFYRLWQKKLGEINVLPFPSFKGHWIPIQVLDTDNTIKHHFPLLRHPYFTLEFGRVRLESFAYENYGETRNFPAFDGSSRLSPYSRFGIFSVRQIYAQVKEKESSE